MQKAPYASIVGSLMCVMICTRLDIAHVVSIVSKFLFNPGKKHWEAVEWKKEFLGLFFGIVMLPPFPNKY